MSREAEILQDLLAQCKLDDPVADEVQEAITAVKEEDLKAVLKKAGAYGLVFGAVVSFFFYVKKFGISLSLAKSAVTLGVVSVAATAVVTTGAYFSGKYIIKKIDEIKIEWREKKEKSEKREKQLKDLRKGNGLVPSIKLKEMKRLQRENRLNKLQPLEKLKKRVNPYQ